MKKVDKNLYTIIREAEFLYRDEYFEQCMVQTRRFGEHICKNVLGNRNWGERTFDDMLATLKDNAKSNQEKEFIDDLYFLKKHGNSSAHSLKMHKDGIEALECLQRAFETALNYCVYSKGASSNLLKLRYDTELLVTGEKSKKTLGEKYKEKKIKSETFTKDKKNKKNSPQSSKIKSMKEKQGFSAFWIFTFVSSIVSLLIIAVILIMGVL